MLHTVFRRGSKFVYIWSPTEIRNHTARPLRIRLHYKQSALRVPRATFNSETPSPSTRDSDGLEVMDFGVIEPGASVPVPLDIKSLESAISFQPALDSGWTFTRKHRVRELISCGKFTLTKSRWTGDYPADTKPWQRSESFFLRPRYHRNLITIIIQSPLIITNLFPFPIRVQLSFDGGSSMKGMASNSQRSLSHGSGRNKFIWEQPIASYESLPVTTDFEWRRRHEIRIAVWIPGHGQSDWAPLPTGDSMEEFALDIDQKVTIFITNRACKSVPFFRDDAAATLAMNMVYIYTKYLFINKTGLELEMRSPKRTLSVPQTQVVVEMLS